GQRLPARPARARRREGRQPGGAPRPGAPGRDLRRVAGHRLGRGGERTDRVRGHRGPAHRAPPRRSRLPPHPPGVAAVRRGVPDRGGHRGPHPGRPRRTPPRRGDRVRRRPFLRPRTARHPGACALGVPRTGGLPSGDTGKPPVVWETESAMDYTIVVIAIFVVALVAGGGALLVIHRRQVGPTERKPEVERSEGSSGAGATAVLEPEAAEGGTAVAEPEAPVVPAPPPVPQIELPPPSA